MLDQLSSQIWNEPAFHADLDRLSTAHMRSSLLIIGEQEVSENLLSRLLRSAVAMSSSSLPAYQATAYKIVTAATQLEGERYDALPFFMQIVLSRMGNFPAAQFAQGKFGFSPFKLPLRLASETTSRAEANTVSIDGRGTLLTDFQLDLWKNLQQGKNVGISAPTSAGKSFILQAYVRQRVMSATVQNVAFLVPTRALINEVADRIAKWLNDSQAPVDLITTPISSDTELPGRGIYVVTQERLQLIMESHPALKFELLIVDEAQGVSDGPRGVLLSSVVQDVLARSPDCQMLFAGPNISNPEMFGKIYGKETSPVRTELSPVSQNIIFVDCDPVETEKAKLSLLSGQRRLEIGSIDCSQPLLDHRSKLINLAQLLGATGQSLIYAMGAAECEDIAFGLGDGAEADPTPRREELSAFIAEAVHSKFLLAKSVLKGIGYHYGRLPTLVRRDIEDAFSEGAIQYLATTSTLLYGVNLPARNLFLHNPQRGRNTPISTIDFWNLAGRAGRLGKEFEGNIFLIDYGQWPTDPISGERERVVKPALQTHVITETDALLAYMLDENVIPNRLKQDEFENTFVKLYRDYVGGTIKSTLEHLGLREGDDKYKAIIDALYRASEKTTLPAAVFNASPTVSIYRQEALFDRLVAGIRKKGPEYVIPRHPLDSSAYVSLLAVFKRCHGEVLKIPKSDMSHKYYAMLALRWMKGHPLPQIIDASFDYKKSVGQNPNIATVIRTSLTEIENDLRFKYVRLMGCYNAVLKHALNATENSSLTKRIPAIPLYLEIGACSATMMSFMGLGLSRYTAAKLARLPKQTDMSQSDARAWIKAQDLESLNIPSAAIKEIRTLVR